MEKPRVERERACERACGMYLEIVRRTLVRERVVVCVVHGMVRKRVRGEMGWRLLRFVLPMGRMETERKTCEGCVCRLLSRETGIGTMTL